jgi:hypothetical protein
MSAWARPVILDHKGDKRPFLTDIEIVGKSETSKSIYNLASETKDFTP